MGMITNKLHLTPFTQIYLIVISRFSSYFLYLSVFLMQEPFISKTYKV